MFTGIIEAVGTIKAININAQGARLVIATNNLNMSDVKLGDPIFHCSRKHFADLVRGLGHDFFNFNTGKYIPRCGIVSLSSPCKKSECGHRNWFDKHEKTFQ